MNETTPDPLSRPSNETMVLDADGIHGYLTRVWPEVADHHRDCIVDLQPGSIRFARPTQARHVRPGGSLSGPTLMSACDQAAFMLVLAHLGDAAMAVTSHLSMDFLRRAVGSGIVVDARLEKLGRTQLTITARLHTPEMGSARPCALATVVYSRALLGG